MLSKETRILLYDILVKEGLKKLSWSAIFCFFVLFLAVLDAFIDFPDVFDVKKSTLYSLYSQKLKIYIDNARDFTYTHPLSISTLIFLLAFVIALIVVTVRLNRKIRRLPENSHANAARGKVAESIGLVQRWPNAAFNGNLEGTPWAQIISEISSPKNNSLRILGANGERTFSDPKSPLFGPLSGFSGEIRVVLLDPESPNTAARATSVKCNPTDYKRSINKSRKFLTDLYALGKSIKGKLYTGRPNWKLIITDDSAWVQYYTPGGPDIENTPMYAFENNDSKESFYNLYSLEFERIWDRCGDNHFAGR